MSEYFEPAELLDEKSCKAHSVFMCKECAFKQIEFLSARLKERENENAAIIAKCPQLQKIVNLTGAPLRILYDADAEISGLKMIEGQLRESVKELEDRVKKAEQIATDTESYISLYETAEAKSASSSELIERLREDFEEVRLLSRRNLHPNAADVEMLVDAKAREAIARIPHAMVEEFKTIQELVNAYEAYEDCTRAHFDSPNCQRETKENLFEALEELAQIRRKRNNS